jgi:hypothetical protein
MYARRFLGCIFVLTLVCVIGGFALFQWGGQYLISKAQPEGHFEAARAGDAPDYRLGDAWLARPSEPSSEELVNWLPTGGPAETKTAKPAAVFYIHPTTYLLRDRWNAPLHLGGNPDQLTALIVRSQASAFNGVADIWVPRYRQAAFGAFLLDNADAEKALDFAYRDVAAAFDEFVKEAGDRPIILAGHSQGALHLERLLKEKVAGKPIASRVVAAYAAGWPISTKSDLPVMGLPACSSPQQTGCILSWMSFAEPANPDLLFNKWRQTRGYNGGERRQQDVLCVNPISGVKDSAAQPADNAGTLLPSSDMQTAALAAGRVGARCSNGLLMISGDIPAFNPPPLPGNNFHVYDYALFWGSIRRDAERRLAAWHR